MPQTIILLLPYRQILLGLCCFPLCAATYAGAFIFAGEGNLVDVVAHPTAYSGQGGTLAVRVCIVPGSPNAVAMEFPVQNNIAVFNQLQPTTGNLASGTANNIPAGQLDFESVALHELGHCIGLDHVNAASESGLSGSNQNYTRATKGGNNQFDIAAGTDGIIGSADDERFDDVNLHWYRKSNNNPFTIDSPVDSSTYARDTSMLPAADLFAANADRAVANSLGFPDTEAVMQQQTFFDEAQRRLTHDDVATVLYAGSGKDELAGSSDDYSLTLEYAGISSNNCDINLSFDDAETGLAVCKVGGAFLNADHIAITSANIYFNTGYNWFFNTDNQPPVLASIGDQPVTEGQSIAIGLSAVNPDNDLQNFSVSGLPVFASLTDHGDDTATLDVVASSGDAGTYTVTVTVTDDGLPALQDSETFDIIVSAVDSDGDGLSDTDETVLGSDPNKADTDGDGLADGVGGIVPLATLPGGVDSNGDGFVDGEQDFGTSPLVSNVGDIAPRGTPDNVVNSGDLVVLTRLVTGVISANALETFLADLNNDSQINAADLLLLQQILLAEPLP